MGVIPDLLNSIENLDEEASPSIIPNHALHAERQRKERVCLWKGSRAKSTAETEPALGAKCSVPAVESYPLLEASLIVTANKPFGRCEVFGDAIVAAAMIDCLVHHAEVISLKGDSYRLKDRDLGRVPNVDAA